MCAILGYLSRTTPIEPDMLVTMRDRMRHRGPDDSGIWLSDDRLVGIAHRRLAIVDLTQGGHQPMASDDGRLLLTFNGEIYNHRELRAQLRALGRTFRSASDTEVLLVAYQHWGEHALARLSGMFAFAVYDREARTLFAARDRVGEKPFFYRHTDSGMVFASELKALLAHPDMPRRADPAALDHYLAYGYVPRDLCLLAGYAKLPAASTLKYDLRSGKLDIAPYWTVPHFTGPRRSMDALAEEFEPLLDTAVRRQLAADVPAAILLSGGLDSSLVAAAAVRAGGKVTTFTAGFPGHGAFDERPIARRLAGALGTEHVEIGIDSAVDDLIPKLAAQFDEPIGDSSMIPTHLIACAVRARATVVLGGDGGDELFGGYVSYSWLSALTRLRRLGFAGVDGAASRLLPYSFRARKMLLRLLDRNPPEVTVLRLMDPALRHALSGSPPFGAPERMRSELVADRDGPLDRAMTLDFLTYLCDDILVKGDRASMMASLELRAPLLDHTIVEFAFGRLAPEQKVRGNQRKPLLRHLARRRLPAWFDVRRKQGFSIPLAQWLRGPWAGLIDDLASDGGDGLLDREGVRAFLRSAKNTRHLAHQVYQLAILEMWRREYRVTLA